MAGAQPLPPPQSANEVTAAIAAAVRSGAGFAGGEGVEGSGGSDGDLFGIGREADFRCAPVFDRPLVRAVRKQPQTIALLSLAHFDYQRAGVSQFVSQFVSHFRRHPFT
jgi:hypothetical protein